MVHSKPEGGLSIPTEYAARLAVVEQAMNDASFRHGDPALGEAVLLLDEVSREIDAHLHAIRSVDGSCPQCADTKRDCANIIAEFEVERRRAGGLG